MTDERDSVAASLRGLAIKMAKLAERAEMEAADGEPRQRAHPESYLLERSAPMLAEIARSEYEARKCRRRYIDAELLGEPAWDILLDLFIHQVAGRRVSLTSSSLASHAPHATAMRYFSALEQYGFVCRHKSETDARVTFLALTPEGFRRVGEYLRERARTMLDAELPKAIPMGRQSADAHTRLG